MANFKFGDMICYKGSIPLGHDEPLMYVGPCNHPGWLAGDIDMLSIPDGVIDHKDPAMWQKCRHLVDADGYLPGENPKDDIPDSFSRIDPASNVRVFVGGTEIDGSQFQFNQSPFFGAHISFKSGPPPPPPAESVRIEIDGEFWEKP